MGNIQKFFVIEKHNGEDTPQKKSSSKFILINQINNKMNANKIQSDATVCRYLFTAKLLYMFRVSQHPSSGALKTVTAASGIGHNTGRATPLQRGLIGHVGGK